MTKRMMFLISDCVFLLTLGKDDRKVLLGQENKEVLERLKIRVKKRVVGIKE